MKQHLVSLSPGSNARGKLQYIRLIRKSLLLSHPLILETVIKLKRIFDNINLECQSSGSTTPAALIATAKDSSLYSDLEAFISEENTNKTRQALENILTWREDTSVVSDSFCALYELGKFPNALY